MRQTNRSTSISVWCRKPIKRSNPIAVLPVWTSRRSKQFEADLAGNLYKIWNRMSSGSYFPPPVRAVAIPKKSGGERILGVPYEH
jgi:retron-type reverse transcriptase